MPKWQDNCGIKLASERGNEMASKVLIVDDSELNRELLRSILEDRYEIEVAENGKVALKILIARWNQFDALLLDIHMPEMNGFELLKYMKENGWINKLPVLIISGECSVDVENSCFELGASDFVHKPFDATLVKNRIKTVVELFSYKNKLEEKVEKQTATLRSQYQMLQMQTIKLRETNDKIVEILGTIVEYRNLESGKHIQRVKSFTKILADQIMKTYPEYGLTEAKIKDIVTASALHDIGKIAIPDKILLKPARFTDEEFEFMKSHTTRGCDMLQTIEGIWDDKTRIVTYEICRFHHERYDGKGYPDGLKGEEIPLSAQIVAVADVYDALTTERVYKNEYSKDEAYHMIINGECGMFSPKIMECFRQVREAFEAKAEELK